MTCRTILMLVAGLPLLRDARAEEGMWLFDSPPLERIEERCGVTLQPEWLEHLRGASLRLSSGGSGSFVSPRGLILTNHHVGAGVIASLSTAERDLMKDGFLARSPADELPCGDLEAEVLRAIRDVTAAVEAAVEPGMDEQQAMMARRAVIAGLEKVSDAEVQSVKRSVVTLYQGGVYHLYEYRRYTDVRLVFAPERAVAMFGGDPDNFEFPRFSLDCCFLRAYEDGEPAEVSGFLGWSPRSPVEGEPVFVAGHPGSTDRGSTCREVLAMRDFWLPYQLEKIARREVALTSWSGRSLENRRRAEGPIFGLRNGRKALRGKLEALLDPALVDSLRSREEAFRARLSEIVGGAGAERAFWEIGALVDRQCRDGFRGALLGGHDAFDSRLFDIAWTLVEAAEERAKPEPERLPGYREADRVSLELRLFSEDPIYPDMEELRLADSLTFLCEKLGAQDPSVESVLGGEPPRRRARELVGGCGLADVAVRHALYEGGMEAIEASDDPMIVLARRVMEESRELQSRYLRDQELLRQHHAAIARARFELDGRSSYPDATFSLRLSFGRVAGIDDGGVPFATDFEGLFGRAAEHRHRHPFGLPPRWREGNDGLDRSVCLNFTTTNDIIGGNSGSPVVDRAGDLIGLIFDSNLHGLAGGLVYEGRSARAICVSVAGITEALRSVYEARELLDELGVAGN